MTDVSGVAGRFGPEREETPEERADNGLIPGDIRGRLSDEQARRMERIIADSGRARHRIKYRVSSRFLGQSFYVAVFAGSEKRGPDRVAGERKSLWRLAVDLVLFGWWVLVPAVSLLLGMIAGGYLMKSWLGIDLFDDHFILHRLFFA